MYEANAGCPFARRDRLQPGFPCCADDHLATAEPVREWRYGAGRILDQQGHEAVDVSSFPGVDVALHEAAQALVSERAQRRPLALPGMSLLDRPAGPLRLRPPPSSPRGDGASRSTLGSWPTPKPADARPDPAIAALLRDRVSLAANALAAACAFAILVLMVRRPD